MQYSVVSLHPVDHQFDGPAGSSETAEFFVKFNTKLIQIYTYQSATAIPQPIRPEILTINKAI